MVTPEQLTRMKAEGQRIAALTAYDYPSARLLDEAGVDVILVGDSLGMVVLGYLDTTYVTLQDMVHHTRAVCRGVQHSLVLADLPYHTYDSDSQARESAMLLMGAGAQAVKLEGGVPQAEKIQLITDMGIPVVAHIGMLPQRIQEEGKYRIKGRSDAEAAGLLADARAVEAAGASAVVLELVLPEVAEVISRALRIPTIGIGSGDVCDGEILVTHDLIGFFPWFTPKFARPIATVGENIRAAAAEYVQKVRGGQQRDK